MYLKISDEKVIDKKDIVAILDIRQIDEDIILNDDIDNECKSLIILDNNGREEKLFSCASPQTLLNRAKKSHF